MKDRKVQGRLGGRFTRDRQTKDDTGRKLSVKHGGRTIGAFGCARSKSSIGNHWLLK